MKNLILWLTTTLALLGISGTALAQTNDTTIEDYIFSVCQAEVVPADLIDVCANALAPGPKVGNAGSVGASGTTSNVAAYLKRRAIEKREKEEEESEQTGGGASADTKLGRVGIFANLAYLDGKRDTTQLENGFDINQIGIVAGSDYRFNDKLFAGGALGFAQTENTLNSNAGKVDSDNVSLTAYSNYTIQDNLAVDGYLSVGALSYDSTRKVVFGAITEDANASYDAQQFALGASSNYSFYVKSLTLSGIAKVDYISTDIDAYDETGGGGLNFSYEKQSIESLTSKLGIQASYAWSQSWGVILPQGRVHYIHEFSNDSRSVESALVLAPQSTVTLTTDEPDRDYFIGAIGASVVLPGGMQTFVDVEFLSGHAYLSTWTATAGLRWEI
jgi:outer membrane lipase/esterase